MEAMATSSEQRSTTLSDIGLDTQNKATIGRVLGTGKIEQAAEGPDGRMSATIRILPDQLVFREARCHSIERGATLAAGAADRVAVAALLGLEYDGALALQWSCAMNQLCRQRITAPRVHHRTPGSERGKMREDGP